MIFNIAKQGIVATFLGLFAISAAQGQIYVANGSDYVAEYAPSGTAINTSLIHGPMGEEGMAISGTDLFIVNSADNGVSEYNATTGAVIKASFITGLSGVTGLVISGSDLYVASSSLVGVYNAITGTAINASLASPFYVSAIAVSGNDLFAVHENSAVLSEYNATTGATINSSFIAGVGSGYEPNVDPLLIAGNDLYIANYSSGTVSEYNATTGALLHASFISGLSDPADLAIYGNILYVTGSTEIGEYNATTGATIKANFLPGTPFEVIVVVPEPSNHILLGMGFFVLLAGWKRSRRFSKTARS